MGLFTANIGQGIPITGILAGVNWSIGAKFIQVAMDPLGGTTYVDLGTTQMFSVPYALQQAIAKTSHFNFDLKGAVMASDAFFPFPDCVNIAHKAGITAIVQPGGSLKDGDSIIACDNNSMATVTTGIRHFKH